MRRERVDQVLRRQHALVTRTQALAAGLTEGQLRSHLETGRWEVVHRGVYRLAGAPASDLQRLMAAVLGAGTGAWRRTGRPPGSGA